MKIADDRCPSDYFRESIGLARRSVNLGYFDGASNHFRLATVVEMTDHDGAPESAT